nr:MAG TPA: hypothetical protein [Caudoviricetes sp.]
MKLTELQIPDLKTMAAGRKAAETARELKELKRRTSLLRSALMAAIEDRNTALGRVILWRWVAALEGIAILLFIAARMLKA